MLAVTAPAPFSHPDWRFEVKWDGWRAVVSLTDRLQVWSRRGQDLLARYPVLTALQDGIEAPAVLDGELVAFEQGAPSFAGLARPDANVVFIAFDCLYDRQGWHLHEALAERLTRLERCTRPAPRLVRAEGIREAGGALFDAVAARGLEGVMAKRLDGRYHPGRRVHTWQKFLVWHEERFWAVAASPRQQGWIVRVAEAGAGGELCPVGHVTAPAPPPGVRAVPGTVVTLDPPEPVRIRYRTRTVEGKLRHATFRGYGDAP
jgi:ATP-dependent DNA ligase